MKGDGAVADQESQIRDHHFLRNVVRKFTTEIRDDEAGERQQAAQYEAQIADLEARIRQLEQEGRLLRRRTGGGDGEALGSRRQDEVLQKARAEIVSLREEVDKLTSPPLSYGVFLEVNEDKTLDVIAAGRKLRVNAHPKLDVAQLRRGQEVVLNDALNVVLPGDYERQGELVRIKELLDDRRAMVTLRADEVKVVEIADPLHESGLKVGDLVRLDSRTGHLHERMEDSEVHDLLLEEVPDVTYGHIGGLSGQVERSTQRSAQGF